MLSFFAETASTSSRKSTSVSISAVTSSVSALTTETQSSTQSERKFETIISSTSSITSDESTGVSTSVVTPTVSAVTFSTSVVTPTVSAVTTETQSSTQSEEATSSPLSVVSRKSVPASVIAGPIGVIIFIVVVTIGLVVFFRQRKRRYDAKYICNIHYNQAYDEHGAPSADNVSASSKDSGFGKHESVEGEMMDGDYNTLRLHFPVNNGPQGNTYNRMDEYFTADSTYSHIPSSKEALFDNTYSHMSNVAPGKKLKPQGIDTTYNHLGKSNSSKLKVRTEETSNDTYSHVQMNPFRPAADQDDQDDNYSHINQAGLNAQMPNAVKQRAVAKESMNTNAEYAEVNYVDMLIDKGKKQHGDAQAEKASTTTAEDENEYEGHTYFVLESNTGQHPKQARYDYEEVATPDKDHTEFQVVDSPKDTQHEYFVIKPSK
ncbi:uncharacterized protein LOC128238134 [Mya arenaria]|uniref:uncharacterized protein LOC128238134 n=1 Tax=Mya arenaria TaxID=6604 RepID=UPI0022E0C17D|nr:uncharacterized protein LOC128238134 [Mya arenaria]